MTINLILEFNVYEKSKDAASVWIVSGELNDSKDLEHEPSAVKIAGPLPHQTCEKMIVNLRTVFSNLGYEVKDSSAADD